MVVSVCSGGVFSTLLLLAAAGHLNAQQKAPVPDAAAVEAAQKAANELFGSRFRSAKTPADKAAVAAEMIDAALKLEDGLADQYVLLKIAREIAVGAGDAATALQAAEGQAKRFDVPAAKLKAETLLAAAREARATPQQKAVAEAALQVVKDWADASEVELPLSVCEAGRSAAQKARQFELVKELAAKADDLKKQRKAAQEYREALAVMQDDPVEPAANLTAGRYLCFVAGDWEQGVPYLALGSDAGLKAVALQGTARGRFGRRTSGDRRHVVGLGRGQAGLRAGRAAAPRRGLVSAGRAAIVGRTGGPEAQTASGGSREARPGNSRAHRRCAEFIAPTARDRPVRCGHGKATSRGLGQVPGREGRDEQFARYAVRADPARRVRHGIDGGGSRHDVVGRGQSEEP